MSLASLLQLLAFLVTLFTSGQLKGHLQNIVYVSRAHGQEKFDICGSKSIPCKTLQLGFKKLALGGTLYLDGEKTDNYPYTCNEKPSWFEVEKNFSLSSYMNSTARISCPNGIKIVKPKKLKLIGKMNVNLTGVSFVESKALWLTPGTNLILVDVFFRNTVLRLKDASAVIQNCKFKESSPAIKITISTSLPSYFLKVKDTLFERNCGCIKVNPPSRKRSGCNRQVVIDLEDVFLQDNTVMKNKDKESGLIFVKGSRNCNCKNISFSSTWKNVTAINNEGNMKLCNIYSKKKSKDCCLKGKADLNLNPKSLFYARACRIHLSFSDVTSKNNRNMRFVASQSRFNNISVDKSSFHGHHTDNPGGVMHIQSKNIKEAIVNLTVTDSVFSNNVGGLGGVIQVDGGQGKVVALNMSNVSLLSSHGKECGCVVSVGEVNYIYDKVRGRVAKITTNFYGLQVKNTSFFNGESGNSNTKQHFAAFCLAASNVSKIFFRNSLFYQNKVPALLVEHKCTDTSTSSHVINVKIENTNFTENECPPRHNATLTILNNSPRPVLHSSLTILNSLFLNNKGIAVTAKKIIQIKVVNVTCRNNLGMCMNLTCKRIIGASVNSTIVIKDSVFSNNTNSPIVFRHTKPKFMDFQIRNTVFHNNRYKEALNIKIGHERRNNSLISGKLVIDRTNFTSNSVDFASSNVLRCNLLMSYKANFNVLIRKSVFRNNFQNPKGNIPCVSSVFFFYVPEDFENATSKARCRKKKNQRACGTFPKYNYKRRLLFQDVEFENNTGSSSMLYLNNGNISFRRCVFKDNYSQYPKSGAHVFIEEGQAGVSFLDSHFKQAKVLYLTSEKNITPWKVSALPFVYAGTKGPLEVRNSSFIFDTFKIESTLFSIQNGRYVHFDSNTNLSCPMGSFIKLENTSHVIQPMFTRDHCCLNITRVRLMCQMCPVSTYSLQRGLFRGLFNKTYVDCVDCPFGANCTLNIKSKKNFWGYLNSTDPPRLLFKSCPENYCLVPQSMTNSSVYNRCSGYREGTMCGACKQGYSESMFNHKCRPNSECKDVWFWVIVALYSAAMAIYVLLKPPIVLCLVKKILWFRRKDVLNPNSRIEQVKNCNYDNEGHGYSKIIFYFYQVADLLMLQSSSEILQKQIFLSSVISFYNFQVEVADSSFGCPFPGLTAVTKELFLSLQVFVVMVTLVFFYFVNWLLRSIRKKARPHFAPYLASIVEVLLLGYERLGHATLRLLQCTPIKVHGRVTWKMFIDGNIACWVHWWQYALIAYNIIFVIPFLLVLLVGTSKLRRQEISALHFVASCFVPLPFLTYWMVKSRGKRVRYIGEDRNDKEYRRNLLEVIQGPFRPPKDQSKGALYWESILIGRRLVLLCLHSLVATPMLRLLSMTFVCLLILLHDLLAMPFMERKANALAAFLLFTHVVLGAINLSKASLINAGVTPQGPPQAQIRALKFLEIALLGILPCAFCLLVVVCLISQAIRLLLMACLYLSPKMCSELCMKRPFLQKTGRRDLGECYQPLLDPSEQ